MFNIAVIGQLIASRFPRALSGYLLADWDGYLPYDYIRSDTVILADGGGEMVAGSGPLGWIAAVNCNNLTNLNCNGTDASRIIITGCNSLAYLACTGVGNSNFTTLDLSTDTALTDIECYNNCLSTLIIPSTNTISTINASRCQFTQIAVDNIIIALASNSITNGNLNINNIVEGLSPCGGSNAIPTANGFYTTLTVTKGWTVSHN